MSLIVVKLTNDPVILDDLGITISGLIGVEFDLTDMSPNDIALSGLGGDLEAAINGTSPFTVPELVVKDPRAGKTGNLSQADSLVAVRAANDVHIGIQLASISDLDDVGGVPSANEVLEFNSGSGQYEPVPASTIAGNIALGDLSDVGDATPHTANSIYVFKGDGTNLNVVDLTSDADVVEGIEDIVGNMGINGTDTTFTYNDVNGTIEWSVNDVFLRNTGDTLDSGTLTIASGASISVASGASITITDAPVNGTDAVNKDYVDGVAAGLDPKESVRVSTTADLSGTYNASGGTGGSGAFTAVDLTNIDGLALSVGDRLLVKDQIDPLQNGIYVVTTAGATGAIERAADQDGTPANEVSGGNFTFVEQGSSLAGTGWVVVGDGILALNTDPIVWTQFSESSSFTAGPGLNLSGSQFSLDVDNLTAATIALTDEIAFNDVSDSNTTRNTTVSDFLNDLNIPNGVNTNGIVVNNSGTYSTVSIAIDGPGALDGLSLVNADGTAGNPTLGLDINNLPVRSDAVDLTDRVAVYNVTAGANEYYTVSELANAGAANAFGVIVGDTGTATADSPSDTVTFTGSGITITATAGAAAAVDFAMDISDLSAGAGAVDLTDSIAVGEGANTVRYTFQEMVDDLAIPNNVSGTGFVVSDGAGSYTTRDIIASTNEDLLGINVTPTDGTADAAVGLDIVGLTDPDNDMAATDEFAVHDKSEGTGGANRKMTGQNIADGVATLLNLPSGLAVTTIGGQEVLTLVDTTRANKVLSIETTAVTWSENRIGNNDWVQIGNANDANVGYIVPLNATIVKVTAHTTNDNNNSKDLDLYVDGVLSTSSIVSFTAVNGQNEFSDVTTNVDITAGEKIQIRGGATGGAIEDTVITVWLKWRG